MSGKFGKYRGKVVRSDDPLNLGRVMVTAPSVLGPGAAVWAMPCSPFAGPGVGLILTPPRGANVWVEFEGGQIDSPIWTGGFWDRGQYPLAPGAPETVMLKTGSTAFAVNDTKSQGGVSFRLGSPASSVPMTLSAQGGAIDIAVKDAKLKIGPDEVRIKIGATDLSLRAGKVVIVQGGARIEMSQGTISMNNGQLEVKP